jgi:3-methylcrotonyl-CoA carboxylase alpha subunit
MSPKPPFESVLIANRGEIACRIIRTAKRLGIRTIAVFSDADRNAMHVRAADEAHYIGPSPARDSYLDIMRLIDTARRAKAVSLHPGYGFLSERAELAEACKAGGIVFIGPSPQAIRAMGDKAAAKALMQKAGVPVVPGYHGERQEAAFLRQKAYELGYPIAIKAAAGGGGKGMRRVAKAIEFDDALAAASREAEAAFGDKRVLIEKWIESPRHIEVQIFADQHGNVLHLYERDCSAQRRHQKVIEESPAPGMNDETRAAMTKAAVEAARAANYSGAGTVEFIADGKRGLRPDGFWFLEMNTRLQVEHPVTEAVTGIDLVEWQFLAAAGEKIALTQAGIKLSGHAVEARLYAEEPERGFLPSIGKLVALKFPSGDDIRVDTGVEEGSEVTQFYDPMIAKIITYAPTREEAFDRLAHALQKTLVAGPRSNLAFLSALVASPAMRKGEVDTGYIEREITTLAPAHAADFAAAARAVEALVRREEDRVHERAKRRSNERISPWDQTDAFGFTGPRAVEFAIRVNGERAKAQVSFEPDGPSASIDGKSAIDCLLIERDDELVAVHEGRQTTVRLEGAEAADSEQGATDGVIVAPMHGKLLSLSVKKGESVKKGQLLAVIEAMKMEHALTAPANGKVAEIAVLVGDQVKEGARLLVLDLAEETSAK